MTKFALSDGKGVLSIHPVTKFPAEAIVSDIVLIQISARIDHHQLILNLVRMYWRKIGKVVEKRCRPVELDIEQIILCQIRIL